MSHSTTTMTGRERVNRMMERRDQDRIPRHESFWSDTIRRWESEGLEGGQPAVLDLLGSDFQGVCWSWPSPYPGRRDVIEEDDETIMFTDQFGQTVREWKSRAGTPEHHGWECTDRQVWEQTIKPALLATGLHVDVEKTRENWQRACKRQRWSYMAGIEPFEMTRKLIGDEVTMMAMALEPEWIADVAEVTADLSIRDYQALIDAGIQPDGLWTYGDMAYNHATMCSPQMYRDLIWPQHKRLVDFAHQNGMKFIYHTDGDINGVIDLYIDAGVDCLQPLEAKANMDIRKLCPKYGDKLAFFGNIDVMVMATNDLEKIEAEIASKLAAGKATKGYAYHSDHSVPPQVSWDTYKQIIQLVDRYGHYDD